MRTPLPIHTNTYSFYYGIGNDLGWSDPVFQKRMKEAGVNPSTDPENAGRMMIDTIWHGPLHIYSPDNRKSLVMG
jgi:hypothetical protein